MKTFLLILIFGTACLWSYSQTDDENDEEETIISMHHGDITVNLHKFWDYDTLLYAYYIEVRSIQNKLGRPFFKVYSEDCPVFFELIYDRKPDSIFQLLYDWLKALENVATKYGKTTVSGPWGDSYLKVELPWIFIMNINRDTEFPFIPLSIGMIDKLKKRIIEYTVSNNISIKL